MSADADALARLAEALSADPRCMSASVRMAGRDIAADSAALRRVVTPVPRRMRRGGAYFEDVEAYQARVRTADPSVAGLLPRVMLGPSAEFADVRVLLEPRSGDAPAAVALHANLTGTVQSGGTTELVLTVRGTGPTEAPDGAAC